MLPTDADPVRDDAPPAPLPPPMQPPAAATTGSPRVIGGVAALLGDRLQIDPLWLRLVFVVLTVFSGLGIVLYAALWLGLVAAPRFGTPGRVLAIAVAILGCAWVVDGSGSGLLSIGGLRSRPILFALLLGGVALALWRPTVAAPRAAAVEPSTPTDAVPMASSKRAPRSKRPPSPLGRSFLAAALVVAAAGAIIDRANGGRLHPEQWLGAAAIVCGIGLVVGAFAGHGRWLIVPAVLFAGAGWVWGTTARLGVPLTRIGDRSVSIGSTDGGTTTVRTATGSIDAYVGGRPAEQAVLDLTTAFGDVTITVDSTVTVALDADADHGTTTVWAMDGNGATGGLIGPGDVADVVVHARTGYGDIRLQQVMTAPPTPEIPVTTVAGLPSDAPLTYLGLDVGMSADGMVVVGEGQDVAVVDRTGAVVAGPSTVIGDNEVELQLGAGTYRLLARQFLLTPDGTVIDLTAERARLGIAPTSIAGG